MKSKFLFNEIYSSFFIHFTLSSIVDKNTSILSIIFDKIEDY